MRTRSAVRRLVVLCLVLSCLLLCGCASQDYKKAKSLLEQGDFTAAAEAFEALGDYQDSADQLTECRYQLALAAMGQGDYAGAAEAFMALNDYQDSADQLTECRYQLALAAMGQGDYAGAAEAFEALNDYQDSPNQLTECRYQLALAAMDSGDYAEAKKAFEALDNYKDSIDQITECHYQLASEALAQGDYSGAITSFEALGEYKDSAEKISEAEHLQDLAFLGVKDDKVKTPVWKVHAILFKQDGVDKAVLVTSKDFMLGPYFYNDDTLVLSIAAPKGELTDRDVELREAFTGEVLFRASYAGIFNASNHQSLKFLNMDEIEICSPLFESDSVTDIRMVFYYPLYMMQFPTGDDLRAVHGIPDACTRLGLDPETSQKDWWEHIKEVYDASLSRREMAEIYLKACPAENRVPASDLFPDLYQ